MLALMLLLSMAFCLFLFLISFHVQPLSVALHRHTRSLSVSHWFEFKFENSQFTIFYFIFKRRRLHRLLFILQLCARFIFLVVCSLACSPSFRQTKNAHVQPFSLGELATLLCSFYVLCFTLHDIFALFLRRSHAFVSAAFLFDFIFVCRVLKLIHTIAKMECCE